MIHKLTTAAALCAALAAAKAFAQSAPSGPSSPPPGVAAAPPTTSQATDDDAEASWGDNILTRTPNDVHELLIDDSAAVFRKGETDEVTITSKPPTIRIRSQIATTQDTAFRQAVYASREIRTRFPFNEVVPSWNVDVPEGAGFVVQLRMRRQDNGRWTDWYYLGTWGKTPRRPVKKIIKDECGDVRSDYFVSRLSFDRLQYRFTLSTQDPQISPVIQRVALAYSNTRNDAALAENYRRKLPKVAQSKWARRLPVPYRSQTVEDREIAGSICSPTSVSMVMEYRGVNQPTAKVADRIWDAEYHMFGNWGRAVQGAYSFGVPGYLRRFGSWEEVKELIAQGQPVIASIRVSKVDGLRGAPYHRTRGHLIVIVGFDQQGNVHVNDPAAKTADKGMATYFREDMEEAWLNRGGLGYILLPPETGN